jgi:hypothetical protein
VANPGIRPGGAPPTISGLAATHHQTAVLPDAPNHSHKSGLLTQIFRAESRSTGRILKEHRMICNPEDLQVTPDARGMGTYTATGYHYEKAKMKGVSRVSITGNTIFRGQNLATGEVVDGMAAWRDFADLMDFLFTGNVVRPSIVGHDPDDIELVWINEQDPVTAQQPAPREFVAFPDGHLPSYHLQSRRPFVYVYGFTFTAVERDPRSSLTPTGRTTSVRPRPRTLSQQLNSLLNEMATLDGLTQRILDDILGPQGQQFFQTAVRYQAQIRTVVQQFDSFAAGATSLVDSTFENVNQILADGETIRDSILSVLDLVSFGRVTGEHAYILQEVWRVHERMVSLMLLTELFGNSSKQRVDRVRRRKGVPAGYQRGTTRIAEALGRNNVPTENPAGSVASSSFTSVMKYPLEQGDTIDSLIAQFGLDLVLLVEVNNLRFPYIDTTQTRPDTDPFDPFGRNILYRGETFVLPVIGAGAASAPVENQILLPVSNTAGTEGSAYSVEERLFGSDLRLDATGDLVLDPTDGDLDTVVGVDNLLQSIDLGQRLQPGQLHQHPTRGCYVYRELGSTMTGPSRELLALGLYRTLLQNPRIASVNYITVEGTAGAFTISYGVTAIGGAQVAKGEFSSLGGR